MRLRVLVLFAVIAFAGIAAAVALGRHGRALSCVSTVGTVRGSYPLARLGCSGTTFTVSSHVYRTDTATTGSGGQLTFATSYLYSCTLSAGSAVVIAPTATVAIQWVRGTTWCRHLKTSGLQYLTYKNTRILIRGTLIGGTVGDNGLLVQLVEGAATVTSGRQSRTLKQGQQVLVPVNGVPGRPTTLVLSPTDQVTVTELQLDVVAMATAEVPQHLQSRGEKSVVIVGQDAATAKRLVAQLRGFRALTLTAAQVTANPQIVEAYLKKIGANSVVTAGTTDSMEPVWTAIRTTAGVSTTTAVVYALP